MAVEVRSGAWPTNAAPAPTPTPGNRARVDFLTAFESRDPKVSALALELATTLNADGAPGANTVLKALATAARATNGTPRPSTELVALLEFSKANAHRLASLDEKTLAVLPGFLALAASKGLLPAFDAGSLAALVAIAARTDRSRVEALVIEVGDAGVWRAVGALAAELPRRVEVDLMLVVAPLASYESEAGGSAAVDAGAAWGRVLASEMARGADFPSAVEATKANRGRKPVAGSTPATVATVSPTSTANPVAVESASPTPAATPVAIATAGPTPTAVPNSAPTAPATVGITPSSPDGGSTLTCSHAGGVDPDGDALTPVYFWYVGGTLVAGQAAATLSPAHFAKGHAVSCAISLGDGAHMSATTAAAPVAIGNRPPAAFTVAVTASVNRKGGSYTCSAAAPSDPDGDTVVAPTYRWLHEGVAIAGATSSTFADAGSVLVKGNTIACEVTYGDGADSRSVSGSTVVGNSKPALIGCVDRNAAAVTFRTDISETKAGSDGSYARLTCTASDPDGDTLSWRVAGCMERYEMNAAGQVRLKSGGFAPGENCHLHVIVHDGSASATDYVSINTSVPNSTGFASLGTTVGGTISSILPIPSSTRYLVGGDFHAVGAYTRVASSVRLKANGVLDNAAWQSPAGNNVHTVATLPDGSFLLGGSFTQTNSAGSATSSAATTRRITHLTSTGALSTAAGGLHASANMGTGSSNGPSDEVEQISHNGEAAAADLRIFVAGRFATVTMNNGGVPKTIASPGIACFTGTWAECATGWRVPTVGGETFRATAVAYGENAAGTQKFVFVGGSFSTVNGISRRGLVRLDAATGVPDDTGFSIGTGFADWAGGTGYTIRHITVDKANEKIYVSGIFSRFNGKTVEGLVRLNWDGAFDTTFAGGGTTEPRIYGDAWKVRLWDDPADAANSPKIYVAGDFNNVRFGGQSSQQVFPGLVRLNKDGSRDAGFCPGGTITGSACDLGSDPTDFQPRDLAVRSDGSIVVVGDFKRIGQSASVPSGVAVLGVDGTLDSTWLTAGGTGFALSSGKPEAIALVDDANWIVAGDMDYYKGIHAKHVALWDTSLNAGAGGWDAGYSAGNRIDEPATQIAADPVDPNLFYYAGYFCSGTFGGTELESAGFDHCGIVRARFSDFTRDTSFSAKRSVFLEPQRIAFVPDRPAFGDAAGDIIAVGAWSAYEWYQPSAPLQDHNLSEPGAAYLQSIARLNRSNGAIDLAFDTGFVPVLCSDDGNAANETCSTRNQNIGLSHEARRVAFDAATGLAIVSSIQSGVATMTYKGAAFTEKMLRIDLQGNRVAP